MKYTQCENWTDYQKMFQNNFTIDQTYVICGIGDGYRVLLDIFPETKIQYCLDAKALSLPDGKMKVFPYEALAGQELSTKRFIITAGCEYYSEIKDCLLHYGAQAEHIASLQEILFFWGTRYRQKLITSSCAVVLLTHCNLRCKGCVHFIPYIKHFHTSSIESMEENLNQYFRIFDFVKEIILSGGEPMLYDGLGELCAYIRTHFSGRYHELKIFTNGLIEPKEANIAELSLLYGVHIFISDYAGCIKEKQSMLLHLLEKYNIHYTFNKNFSQSAEYNWFDLGDPTKPATGSRAMAVERFQKCSLSCHYLWDHKLFYCGPSWSASVNELAALDGSEISLDLNELEHMTTLEKLNQVGKFNLGFMDQGCLEFCRFCNGYGKNVNTQFIKAGEQC